MGSLKEKAKALLQQCEVVTLTSINKEGYPRPVPLSKIKTEGLTTIWFATGNSSAKTKDFRSNPKAGICFYKEGNSVAMTGEVTLRGRVLAIGGLKEKTMAAYRNGIQTVIIPAENQKDLEEIDQTVRQALHFVPVEQVDEVLAEALAYPITANDSGHVPALPLEDSPAQPAAVGLQQ